jgi:hypothetical protein
MIVKLNHGTGCDSAPGVKLTFNISSLAVRNGAMLMKTVGTNTVALATQTTTLTVLPQMLLSQQATDTSSTTIDTVLLVNGDYLEMDVTEIANATTLVATGGSGTTLVDSSLGGMVTNSLIGSVIKVVTMASSDKSAGTLLTATGYTATASGAGTFTFASMGSTGFASGDTYKIVSLNNDYVFGNRGCLLNTTYMDSIDLDTTNTTVSTGMFVRIIGTNGDGTKLRGIVVAGADAIA